MQKLGHPRSNTNNGQSVVLAKDQNTSTMLLSTTDPARPFPPLWSVENVVGCQSRIGGASLEATPVHCLSRRSRSGMAACGCLSSARLRQRQMGKLRGPPQK